MPFILVCKVDVEPVIELRNTYMTYNENELPLRERKTKYKICITLITRMYRYFYLLLSCVTIFVYFESECQICQVSCQTLINSPSL